MGGEQGVATLIENLNSDSANYMSFLNSVPQLAAYAIVLRDLLGLGIDQVKCITFNKDGAWEFDPDDSLAFINKFLKEQSKLDLAIWTNYLNFY